MYLIAIIAAWCAGVLSTAVGLGGGILLVAILAVIVSPLEAILVSGPVVLVGMGSRAFLLRKEVECRMALMFSIGAVPASLLGAWLLARIDPAALSIALGAALLVSAVMSVFPSQVRLALPDWAFVGVGSIAGLMSSSVGGTGPLVSPFLLAKGLTGVRFVATMAASYVGISIGRVTGYIWEGLFGVDIALLSLIAVLGILMGNQIGARLGEYIGPRLFRVLVICLVVLAAVKLFVDSLT